MNMNLIVIYAMFILISMVICDKNDQSISVKDENERTLIWMSQCKDVSLPCCQVWTDLVRKSDQMDKVFLSYHVSLNDNRTSYDHFEPSWTCELQHRAPGINSKWICGLELSTPSSLIYSFGSLICNIF